VQHYTFVTVSHAPDWPLLRLQARSFPRYCPEALVEQILVIENFDFGAEVDWREELLDAYGPLRQRVHFVRGSDLAEQSPVGGWWSQQVLKLAVSERIGTERYVILDAKNHWVAALSREYLEASDGRPRISTRCYRDHPLRDGFDRTLTYCGLDPDRYLDDFIQSTTPFIMLTSRARKVVADINAAEGRPFAQAFVDRRLIEFILYGASIVASGQSIDDLYDRTQPECPTIWPGRSATLEECTVAVARAAAGDCPCFAIHRLAATELEADARATIARFWCDRGLFASENAGVEFLRALHGTAAETAASASASSSEDDLSSLRDAGVAVRSAERALAAHVDELRRRGVSWDRIGTALGMTRHSVWAKFSLIADVDGTSDEEIERRFKNRYDEACRQVAELMRDRFAPQKASGQSAVIQYDIASPQGIHSFHLKVGGGHCGVFEGRAMRPRVTLSLRFSDLLRIAGGKLNVRTAFFTGRLKVSGDLFFARAVQGWFSKRRDEA
jgi:putative sterol carrier protein